MLLVGPSKVRFPVGVDDFSNVRRRGYTYVDKTRFIAGVLERGGETKLFTRPRRFGKTLNLSTLRYFLEASQDDRRDLFEDTWIWQAEAGRFQEHFQAYPVIALSFKDVRARTWDETLRTTASVIRREVDRLIGLYSLFDHVGSNLELGRLLERIRTPQATMEELKLTLDVLSQLAASAVRKPAVVLIDEYDAPLHAAYAHGYWNEAVSFFRDFLSNGLKGNASVRSAVLSGILRVAQESIFSGLNNLDVYTLRSPYFADCFGFSQSEVTTILDASGLLEREDEVRRWYNGYSFGGEEPHTIYNPWSVIQFASKPRNGLVSYWTQTASQTLIRHLLLRGGSDSAIAVERLLSGESVARPISERLNMPALDSDPMHVWSLLLATGYLTVDPDASGEDRQQALVRIPNREVRQAFEEVFGTVVPQNQAMVREPGLVRAMLEGDEERFSSHLSHVLRDAMSTFDFGARPVEAVYQAFVVGLLVHLEPHYRVRSNREAGYGRADVLITPMQPGDPGAVLELKVLRNGTDEVAERALDEAQAQLIDRNYAAEVRATGAAHVHQWAVAFDGKRCWVRAV